MKKNVLLAIIATILISNLALATDYYITDWTGLQNIENDCYGNYHLMNDIDQSTSGYAAMLSNEGGKGFKPVCSGAGHEFFGTLDGNGYTITGLYINRPLESRVGLIGMTYQTYAYGVEIKNLGLIDATVIGGERTGMLVGFTQRTKISNCYVKGNVNGSNYAGGMIGYNYNSLIENSYSTGKVEGYDYVGGIAGEHSGTGAGIINNAYSTAETIGHYYVAGITGFNGNQIQNSFAAGRVQGISPGNERGIVGFNTGSVTNTYWDICRTGQENAVGTGAATCPGCVGVNDCTTLDQTYFYRISSNPVLGWDFTNYWDNTCNNNGYPTLKNVGGQSCVSSPDSCYVDSDADNYNCRDDCNDDNFYVNSGTYYNTYCDCNTGNGGGASDGSETEICDTIDNDCDSYNDEDLTCSVCYQGETQPCINQQGVCAGSYETCVILPDGEGAYVGCTDADYLANDPGYESPWETSLSDGKDNNCDGLVDDNDQDSDGAADSTDNCNTKYNPDQNDKDGQDGGDVCDICPDDNTDTCTTPASYTEGENIDENGGTLTNAAGECTISIPAGALTGDSSVTMSKGGSNYQVFIPGRGNLFAVYDYALTSTDTTFDQPVTLTFSMAGYGLTDNQTKAAKVYYINDQGNKEWAGINKDGGTVNLTTKTITVQVNHFTKYLIITDPACCTTDECEEGKECTAYATGTECGETGYGVCLPQGTWPPGGGGNGATIPEFSTTTILLMIAIIGLGITIIAKKKK